MEPNVKNVDDDTNTLTFTLSGVNVSIANALRRTILSDIPCVVFKTLPYNDSKITIDINTSNFNNEIIKQRLSCIPIHIDDLQFPIDDYILEIDVKNDTDNVIYITTEDFKLKNVKLNNYLNDATSKKIFPKNALTNYYIDFIRLNPAYGNTINAERVKLQCKLSYGNAKENGSFNVVSTCSYSNTKDLALINDTWDTLEKEYIDKGVIKTELELLKKDWLLLDANRLYIKNSFNFIIQTIGIYTNNKIIELACNVLIKKLTNINIMLNENPEFITDSNNSNENCYDIRLENEDYTIGKILEFILYNKYFEELQILQYCGFIKKHPHLNYSIIRLMFKNIVTNQEILSIMTEVIKDAITCYQKIRDNFTI